MGETTKFIMVLAMSFGVAGWALAPLIIGLRRWETRRLQRRLVSELKGDLTGASPILLERPSEALKDLGIQLPQLHHLAETLRVVWPGISSKKFLRVMAISGCFAFFLFYFLLD